MSMDEKDNSEYLKKSESPLCQASLPAASESVQDDNVCILRLETETFCTWIMVHKVYKKEQGPYADIKNLRFSTDEYFR